MVFPQRSDVRELTSPPGRDSSLSMSILFTAQFTLLFTLLLAVFFTGLGSGGSGLRLEGQSSDRPSAKRKPLDLPSGGRGGGELDEDAPELVLFYGHSFEGDGFYWCLDRSGSMEWAGSWEILRNEVSEVIEQLSSEAEFGLVAFGNETTVWRSQPRRARQPERLAALAWLAAIEPMGETCLLPAALKMLEIAQLGSRPNPTGFIVSDGLPMCGGVNTEDLCLVRIPQSNLLQMPIHTVFVSSDVPGIDFLQALAALCGGEFHLVGG